MSYQNKCVLLRVIQKGIKETINNFKRAVQLSKLCKNNMAQSAITPAQKSFINNFMSLNIEATAFVVVMSEKYDYFYDNNDCYDYDDVKLFDAILATRNSPMRNYVDEVVKARMDILSSDRECAAFIAAMRHFIDNQPKQEAAPVAVPDTLLEEYTDSGCTFGRCKNTKYIQRVTVSSPWGTINFLYRGSKRGAFEEVKKQFVGFIDCWQCGFDFCLQYTPGANAEVVARCQQLDAEMLKKGAIAWYVRKNNFAPLPLALPAPKAANVTDTDVLETAARIREYYEKFKNVAINDAAALELATIKANATDKGLPGEVLDAAANLIKPEVLDAEIKKIEDNLKAAAAPVKNADMLQDWGEKIGGARKDEATSHNSESTPAQVKKLKYGVTGYVTSGGLMTWYPKISPRRYTRIYSVEYGKPVSVISADYLTMREEAERLLIEKYPNIDNIFKFDIYKKNMGGYVVTAKRVNIDVATFSTLDEARAYMQSDRPAADLAAIKAAQTPEEKKKRAAALVVRNSINRPRIGTDYVQFRNITPEELATTFGLRAVEFGNWMTADDRQTSINECYNSFCVLAELLKIDRYKIGRGTLAVAFGARGTGKANAHYEPAKHVINLTRTRGAGSLAHEWAHSIDFNGSNQKSLSNNFYFMGYSWRCKETGSYWGREEEQFARAFETAVHYALKDREVVDDYLVNIIEDCKVYPSATENSTIGAYVINKIKEAL